jgi:hypothetical protein
VSGEAFIIEEIKELKAAIRELSISDGPFNVRRRATGDAWLFTITGISLEAIEVVSRDIVGLTVVRRAEFTIRDDSVHVRMNTDGFGPLSVFHHRLRNIVKKYDDRAKVGIPRQLY